MAASPVSQSGPGLAASRAAGGAKSAAAAGGVSTGGAGAYVLEQFREFYDEVTLLREAALRSGHAEPDDGPPLPEPPQQPGPPPLPGLSAPPPLPGDPVPESEDDGAVPKAASAYTGLTAEEAVRRLQTLLEMQALEAGRRGGEYGVLYYKEAQYVMAALADEIFLSLDWPGRNAWRNDLLETRMFGSYNAGEAFYRQLEKLLKTGDRVQAEIAVVYLLALTLGFRGRYSRSRDDGRIAEYRKQLYYYIYQKRPDLMDLSHRVVPQAYQHTQADVSARLLPSPGRWLWLFAGTVLLYLLASHFVFHDVTGPLIDALDRGGF